MASAKKSHGNGHSSLRTGSSQKVAVTQSLATPRGPRRLCGKPDPKSEILIHLNFSVQSHSKGFKGFQSYSKVFQKKKIVCFFTGSLRWPSRRSQTAATAGGRPQEGPRVLPALHVLCVLYVEREPHLWLADGKTTTGAGAERLVCA
jgi:hypothetical protein